MEGDGRPRQTQTDILRIPELEAGFRLLYELKFAEARAQFAARQKTHPEDPFAGIRGDKRLGIKQIEITATSGRYLRPFAKILLALAALREKKPDVARTQLTELVAESTFCQWAGENSMLFHLVARIATL